MLTAAPMRPVVQTTPFRRVPLLLASESNVEVPLASFSIQWLVSEDADSTVT